MASVAETQASFGGLRDRLALGHRLRRRTLPWFLLAPSLLLLLAFTYLPIVRVAWESLHDKPHATGTTLWVGLGNYTALFADKAFTRSVVNNLVYAAGTVPASMAVALLFALAVALYGLFALLERKVVSWTPRSEAP